MSTTQLEDVGTGSRPAVVPTTQAPVSEPRAKRKPTIALALFGMPLGLAGLGGVWAAAHQHLGAPLWPEEVFYGVGTALWLVFTAVYIWRGMWSRGSFTTDRKHPISGPFAAYIPLVGALLSSHYFAYLPGVGTVLTVAFVAAMAIVGAQLVAHWLNGGVTMNMVHGGYFIPVVAGANVASISFSIIGYREAALAAFGAGLFFFLVVGAVILVRLMTSAELPAALKPSMSAFLAATATSNLAWILMHPGPLDEVQWILTGLLVLMLLVQVVLIGDYRKLSFNASFWIFTFPIASAANYAIRWLDAADTPGAAIWGWAILAVTTGFVLAVAGRTIQLGFRDRRSARSAHATR
jgi:tellurite resistance protein